MHPKPLLRFGHSPARHGKLLQFGVKRGHISRTSCNGWRHHASSPLFVRSMHLSPPYFTTIVIMKAMSQSSPLPWEFAKVIQWEGHYFR